MYLGNISYVLGELTPISTVPYVAENTDVHARLKENGARNYGKIADKTLAEAAYESLKATVDSSGLEAGDIDHIVFSNVCETNVEHLDEEFDQLLADGNFRSTPVYRIGAGQCAVNAQQHKFAKMLFSLGEAKNIAVVCANVVPDSQSRCQVDNTVFLADGACSYLLSDAKKEFEIIDFDVRFDHQLRFLQSSTDASAAIRAFKELRKLLKGLVGDLLERNQLSLDDVKCVLTNNSFSAARQFEEVFPKYSSLVFKDYIPKIAHPFGAEIYYVLKDWNDEGRLESGDHMLLYHCGYSAFGFSVVRKI